jgi:pSer/pThr/pTyr-binding forkhead associated (FHA) protein
MPSLLAPHVPARRFSPKPGLRTGDQHCPLAPGCYGLGGRAADAVPLGPLQSQPRAAVLTVFEDGVTVLQRTTAAVVVRVDGEPVGISAVELRHGARIEFGECRLVFETEAPASDLHSTAEHPSPAPETGESRAPSTGDPERSTIRIAPPMRSTSVTPMTDAALVDVRSGVRYPIPARRMFIGRDDSCDVIVQGNSVSRRHASIAPVAGGFMLRDESANGTLVNDQRIVGTYLLGNGDVVRIQDDELRVELDASAPAPIVRGEQTTLMDLSRITRGVTEEQARAIASRPPKASLEIVRGKFAGASFHIERAVAAIGRGEENDVRIRDDTVSMTHATLLRKQESWFVVDLRSMNGTFVDGSRVSGERELHPGACVRVGGVELVFRAIDSETEAPIEDSSRPGLWRRFIDLLRSVAPPSGGR